MLLPAQPHQGEYRKRAKGTREFGMEAEPSPTSGGATLAELARSYDVSLSTASRLML